MQQFKLSLRFEGSELDWVAVSLKIKWSKIYISLCAAQLLLLSLLAYFYFLLLFSGEVPIWYLDWLLLQSWLKEQFVSDKMLHGVDLVRVQFRAYFAAIKPAFLCKLFKTCSSEFTPMKTSKSVSFLATCFYFCYCQSSLVACVWQDDRKVQ